MARRLRVPVALAVVTLGTTATITLGTSCGGEAPPTDASMGCAVFCVGGLTDAAPEPQGGCPPCATEENGTFVCPTGCTPLG
jgi:hypothetical protein